MNYILDLLPIMPFAVIITAIVYGIFLKKTKSRRENLSKGRMLAEFIFTGWLLMFLYVTQLKSFGNGMGQVVNLIPFKSFYNAFCYGIANGAMVWQFLLNMIMFLPLGFLLPILFPEKCRKLSKIVWISFLFTAGTEMLQLVTMRGSDLDDIIANTLGGIWGYTLYLIAYGIRVQYKKEHRNKIVKYKSQTILSAMIVLLSVIPYILLEMNETRFFYGVYYYGNLRAKNIVNIEEFCDDNETACIYQYYELQTLEELMEELRQTTGLEGEYEYIPDSRTWKLADGNRRIFIYDYNTWSVVYHYGENVEEKGNSISFEMAVKSAEEYLKNFNIDTGKFAVVKNEDEWSEFHTIEFAVNEAEGEILYYGNISLALGSNGDLQNLSYNVITGKSVIKAECISQKSALQVTQNVGLAELEGEVNVLAVDKGWSIIKSTGYIVPTWKILGEYEADGKVYEYNSQVCALYEARALWNR